MLMSWQKSWLGPASAGGTPPSKTEMETRSLLLPQAPLSITHWNTLRPNPRLVIGVNGSVALEIVPVPLSTLQLPVAGAAGALANMVTAAVIGVQ